MLESAKVEINGPEMLRKMVEKWLKIGQKLLEIKSKIDQNMVKN